MRWVAFVFLVMIYGLCPNLAFAHAVEGAGFAAGLTHPVLGLDHFLAMVSVGILSTQLGGKAIWGIPLTFVLVMIVGGALGMADIDWPLVEWGIVASVIVLGVSIASSAKLPLWAGYLCVGFFALFHGHAHGFEMPYMANPYLYALGFVLGTAAIHILGVVVGVLAHRIPQGDAFLRYCGAAIAGMGLHMVVEWL